MTTTTELENIILQLLSQSKADLGASVPRLITQKPQVARNGLVHGLTGQNTFLSDNELVRYLAVGACYFKELRPVGIRETELLQSIIDTSWRFKSVASIASSMNHSSIVRHSIAIAKQHPDLSMETIEAFAEGDAFRSDSTDLDKLGRYETRLRRSLEALNRDFDALQKTRYGTSDHEKFNAAESEGLKWYTRLTVVAKELIEARQELKRKSQLVEEAPPVTTSESTTSTTENLVGKNRLDLTVPLTRKSAEGIAQGHQFGLLTDMERTLFTETKAA